MAINILSISAESAELERNFSSARRTTSWDRLRITCENIKKVKYIGNWIREKHIIPSSKNGINLIYQSHIKKSDTDMDPTLLDEIE
jgi:hypothetical protein